MHKTSLSTVTSLVKYTILQKLTGPAIAGVLLSVLPILFTSVLTYYAVVHEPAIRALTAWHWAGLTIAFAITSAGLTPPTILALLFGYFMGWQAVLPLFIINFGGILLINLLVHWLDQDQLLQFLRRNPKAQSVLDRILNKELEVIFFTKLSPILPFGLTNLVFALSGAKLRNILLGGFLGMTPRTLLAIWSGREAREIRTLLNNPNQSGWGQLIVAALILVSVAGLWQVLRGALKRSV
ncbi:TVP38/TMEM64 family protein [Spirosoma arcticum]